MKDKTSYSYRADTPGYDPALYSIGGKAVKDFDAQHLDAAQKMREMRESQSSGGPNKDAFKAKRKSQSRPRKLEHTLSPPR